MVDIHFGVIRGTSSNIASCMMAGILLSSSGIAHADTSNALKPNNFDGIKYSMGMAQSSSGTSLITSSHSGRDFSNFNSPELSEEFLAEYIASFSRAIDQYNAGDVIKIPNDIQSENEFFEWLKTV
jgi:hypothetical protein